MGEEQREHDPTAMWLHLVADSFVRPRRAARRVLELGFPVPTLLEVAVAITALGMVLGYLSLLSSPEVVDVLSAAILGQPIVGSMMQLAILALAVFLTHRVGRAFGGTGSLRGALLIVVWLNAVMLLIQFVQLVAMFLLPPMAQLLAIVTLIWLLWAFANFVAELHGFNQVVPVLGGVLVTGFLAMFAVAFLMSVLGLVPQGFS